MNRVFAGNANKLKLTSEVLGYAKGVYHFFKGKVKNYRQLAVEAIEDRYNISVSGERLRQLFLIEETQEEHESKVPNENESKVPNENESKVPNENESNVSTESESNVPDENKSNVSTENESNHLQTIQKTKESITTENIGKTEQIEEDKNDKKGNDSCVKSSIPGQTLSPSSNYFPFLGLPLSGVEICSQPRLLQHCGLLLFSPWIDLLFPEKDSENNLNKQWLSHFLLGGVNIEQSKHISFESLEKLIGPVIQSSKLSSNSDSLFLSRILFHLI
ncbi:MAG: hypothetical protein U9O87_03850 [Verrucomicrobiota bacterium]|nr:hypothetical protein [Verrucomicrobiota bacterium]